MSSFIDVKLDNIAGKADNSFMKATQQQTLHPRNVTSTIRQRIEASGERVWRMTDFSGLSFPAVAQALSRLARQGQLRRLGKGLYYRPRETTFGPSLPNPAVLRALPLRQRAVFPVGVAAANMLGFTTQNPTRIELATDGLSLPRLIVGKEAIIHTRRPAAWRSLSETEAALLDFLRNRGESSELSPEETVGKLLGYFREPGRFERLCKVAAVRAAPRPGHPWGHRAATRAACKQTGQLAGQPQSAVPVRFWSFGCPRARTGVAGEGAVIP